MKTVTVNREWFVRLREIAEETHKKLGNVHETARLMGYIESAKYILDEDNE